jgi:hypothetical protein
LAFAITIGVYFMLRKYIPEYRGHFVHGGRPGGEFPVCFLFEIWSERDLVRIFGGAHCRGNIAGFTDPAKDRKAK